MKCIHCGGKMKLGKIPFHIDRKGCHVTLDKVPAWVCGQCGEAYFEEKEVIAIEELIEALEDKAKALLAVG
jgi:YgiT-type zinc finger domain-containing protein